ncbi:hypothetical protein FGG08_005328 [Glutinoglossum americanum]|uniref:Uncharacterized protein n=1 Tax=Glutinoglossum americanum TaxID=1670608 RepID=A0A9P8L1J2_9PEZI|nr:hypothetical protein FGG08_005328 [Glutinoglossum americanum]
MALFTHKTLQFVRAPDENVFIAPFNLIEIFFLVLPFEWWLPSTTYEHLNNKVMGIIYSPLLLLTAFLETRAAHKVIHNRRRGEADDDAVEEWEVFERREFLGEGWEERVEVARPNVEDEAAVLEVKALRKEVRKLEGLVQRLVDGEEKGKGKEDS